MNWTVYCMGDLPIFRDIINAIAMVFNSSLYNPSLGAGLVIVAMLISLFLFAMPALMGKPLSPFPLIFVFMLYFGGIVPKARLQIEDMYTGAVTSVANVPIIVAAPAAISASIARGITDKVETAFSSPTQGTYLGMGAEGFANPLRMLLAFRNVTTTEGTLNLFTSSLTEYVRNCALNAPNYNSKLMYSSGDVLTYLTGLNVAGKITNYYSATSPLGIVVGCDTAANSIVADYAALRNEASTSTNPSKLDKIINGAAPPRNNSTGGVASMDASYNAVTSQLLGNSQTAQMFMSNMIGNIAIKKGVKCANAASPADVSACSEATLTSVAVEQANIDSAANASVFAKTAIPLMNILLALFYAFSPIVLGVALMSAAHGLKIIGGFLMFGAWTQSWMPIAAVLNFMVQSQVQYELSKIGPAGVTMANANDFYTAISLKVGLASELMAMTPIISMVLLSGSMMALSSVAGKFSQDRVDEKTLAPDAMKTGSLAEQGSQVHGHSGITVGNTQGKSVGQDTIQNADNKTSTDIDIASGAKANETQAVAAQSTLATQRAHASNARLKKAYAKARKSEDTQTTEAQMQQMMTQSDKHAESLVNESGWAKTATEGQKTAMKASISAGLNFLGTGAKFDTGKEFSSATALAQSENEKKQISSMIESAMQRSQTYGNKFALSKSNMDTTTLNKEYDLSDSETDTEMEQKTAAVTRAQEQSRSFGASQKQNSTALAGRAYANLSKNGMGAASFDQSAKSKMSDTQKNRYDDLKARHEKQIESSNGGKLNPLTEQQKIDASIQAMASMGEMGMLVDTLSGAGAIVGDGEMLQDKKFDAQMKEMGGAPTGPDVGKVKASTDAAEANAAKATQANEAANNRGSSGVKYVPKTSADGKVLKDKKGNDIYQSASNAVIGAISTNTAGTPPSEAVHDERQQAHVDANRQEFEEKADRSQIAQVVGMAAGEYVKFEEDHPYIAAGLSVMPAGRGMHIAAKLASAKTAAPVLKKALAEGETAIAKLEGTAGRTVAQDAELAALTKAQAQNTMKYEAASKTISTGSKEGAEASAGNAAKYVAFGGAAGGAAVAADITNENMGEIDAMTGSPPLPADPVQPAPSAAVTPSGVASQPAHAPEPHPVKTQGDAPANPASTEPLMVAQNNFFPGKVTGGGTSIPDGVRGNSEGGNSEIV